MAIGSSSKNTPLFLERIGLDNCFDAVADGNQITKSKPYPEVLLLAAKKLNIKPDACVVIEDTAAGIDAALTAVMRAVGVGTAAAYEKTEYASYSLDNVDIAYLLQ